MKIRKKTLRRKKYLFIIPALVLIFTPVLLTLQSASAIASSDGLLFYGAASNTNPQTRSYTNPDSFGSAANTANGTQALATSMKVSPTKYEAIAGYVNSSGVLQVMCYNGASWSNEWTVTVGGTGITEPFDIAYEKTSGDVMVLYGNNGADLGYRTKAGSTGCGSGNWASASTFTPTRTSGTIQWVKLAAKKNGTTDILAGMWADSNTSGGTGGDLSARIWSGSAWGNEPSAALETDMEFATAAQDVDNFDLEYETLSGNLMVIWGRRPPTGVSAAGYIRYIECTNGTSTCVWETSPTSPDTGGVGVNNDIPTVVAIATSLDLAARPGSNQMSMAAMDNAQAANACQGSAGVWNATDWFGVASFDTSSECPEASRRTVTTFWLVNGATARWIVVYDDSSDTGISWMVVNSAAGVVQTDIAITAPTFNDKLGRIESVMSPFSTSEAFVTITDSTGMLRAERVTMTATPAFSWSQADGGASLGTVAQSAVGGFAFAYWLYIPGASTFSQSAYRWYDNADNVTPGAALAAENTAATLGGPTSPFRLRLQLTIGTDVLEVNDQAFSLEYATSTGGPWTTVAPGAAFVYYNNASVTNGTVLASNLLTGTDVSQTIQEQDPSVSNPNPVTVGDQAEWDFSLDPTGATASTTYYFRMVKSGGVALGSYTQYPQITTAAAGPTLQQQMRGGQAVVNGVKYPLTF